MNCNEFNELLIEYISNNQMTHEMKLHIEHCPTCSKKTDEYFLLLSNLKPKVQLSVNSDFKESIINQLKIIKMETNINKRNAINKFLKIAAVVVVIFGIGIFVNNRYNPSLISNASAAENIFKYTIQAFSKVNSMVIKMKVRTLAGDNFELIGSEYEFVDNVIYKEFVPKEKWKIQKPNRVVLFDGENQFLLINNSIALKGSKKSGFVEWMQRLLNPILLFENEIKNAQQCSDCVYSVDKSSNEIILTIKSKAKGNFDNTYMKNSSIEESDSRIVYTFSKDDYLLKDLEVFIFENNKEIKILDIVDIKYNEKLEQSLFEIALPDGLSWKEVKSEVIKNNEYSNISSKEAAEKFFTSCSKREWNKLNDVFPYINDDIKKYLGGLQLISLGNSFKSGLYPGEFVPYEIKLNDGSTKKMNLALRNDNPSKIWMVDGGL